MENLIQQVVGWVGVSVLLVVLFRAVQGRFLSKYPNFHFYIAFVALSSASALLIAYRWPQIYSHYYWASQLICILLGLGVTWECFKHTFPEFSGIRRITKAVLITLSAFTLLRILIGAIPPALSRMVEVERDVRAIQVLMLVCFALLVVYYQVPVGRNILGIALGYGVFVGTNVLSLAFRFDRGPEFFSFWRYLQPVEYIGCELIWAVCLWSYQPGAQTELAQSGDYAMAASRLGDSLTRVRSCLWNGIFQ